MDKNSIEFQELEELRGQVSLLKEKLLRQQIISERAIIEAAQKGIGKLNRQGNIWSVFGVFAVVYCTYVFYKFGYSEGFVVGTAIFLGLCAFTTIYAHMGIHSIDVAHGNLVDIAQRLVRFRKIYSRWHLFSVPALCVWIYFFIKCAPEEFGGVDMDGIVIISSILGGLIGGAIGLKAHFKVIRDTDNVIANINDLMKQEQE